MKRTRLTILSACLLLFVATIASAAPPAGWDPFSFPNVSGKMNLMGSVTLNDLPLPVDNASLIAVFVDNAAVPVGVYKMTNAYPYWATTGVYSGLEVYGYDPGMGDVYSPPKIAAFNGDLLTFKLYYAAIDNVVDVVTVRNYGNIDDAVNYPWNPPLDNVSFILVSMWGVIDNATLNFRYDFPPVFDNVPTSGSINEGEASPFIVHATDPNGDAIAYSATGLPGFCELGPGTGLGLCSPSFSSAGVYDNICFTATSTGFSGTPKSTAPVCVTLTVVNVNRPPAVTIGGDNAATMATYPGQGTPFLRTYAASDLDNEALTWSFQNVPSYCVQSGSGGSGSLSCTPTLANQGTTASNVRVIISDGIDNTVDTFNVTVGNRKPVSDPIADQNVSYAKTSPTVIPVTLADPDGNAVSFTASLSPTPPSGGSWASFDNAARTITVTGPVPIGDAGAYTVTINATDNASSPLTDNRSFTLNIALQIAWDAVPTGKTMNEGGDNTFTFHATDPLAPGLETHILSGRPAFCGTINATTGALRCQPGFADNGVYTMTLRARAVDGVTYAIPDNVSITLTVNNVNRPPAMTVGGDNGATRTIYPGQGTPFTWAYAASDLDNEALTWSLQNNPSYCSLTGSGDSRTLSCTPTLASQGTTASGVRVIVSDGIDNTVDTFNITVGNRKPVITPVDNQSVSYAKTGTTVIPVTISDPDGNGVLSDVSVTPWPPPSGLNWGSYDNVAHTITLNGPVPIQDNGAYIVTIHAMDDASIPLAADNTSFTLNIALQIAWDTVPTNKTMNEGDNTTFTFHATDPLAAGTETHLLTGKPAFCGTFNATTGALQCQPGYTDNGVYSMTLRARAVDNVTYAIPDNVSITLTVNNVNRPPTWTIGGDNTAGSMTTYPGQGTPFTRTYSASDLDNEALTWTFQNVPSYCVQSGSGGSGSLSCTPTLANQGTTASNVRVIVSDGIDNTVDTFTITVGNRKPVIGAIATQNVSYLKSTPTVIPVVLSDPDGNGVSFTAALSSSKSWFAYDNALRTITVTGPVPITDNGAYTVTITATDNASSPLAADNTSFTLNIALQIAWDTVPTNKTMNEGGDNTFTFHATDPLATGRETHLFLGKPVFCVDNVTTGALRCQPGYFDNGVYSMTLRARAIDNVTYALPDNVSITLTVNNVNRSPVLTPTPAGALSGNVGATLSKSYVGSDLDNEALTWTTANMPSFCQLTPSTGNIRTFTCSPTAANEGTFDNVVVRASDGAAQAEESFSVTVNNRAPSISAIADREIVYTAGSTTTIPVVASDPDGNGVTANATLSPSRGWFSFSDNVITIGTGIPRSDAGIYTVTVTATDNGVPVRSAVDVTFTLRVTYPRHFGIPAAQAASMSLGVSGLALNGTPAPLFDEVAAFSVHRVPDSFPTKWESKLVGWGRVDGTAGVLPSMAVYGDNPSTASVREGMTNGEEILLVLWHNDPAIGGQEYYAFDNGAGTPVPVTWDNAVASKELDAVNFIPGNRYPLRNGAWNLFGHGIATGYYVTAAGIPTDNQLTGTTITWNAQADLGNAFPFKSIEGKFDRIISRESSGNKLYYPPIKTMSYFAPGYGYYIRMKAAPADLSWITVPGSPVSASASLAAGPGYSLLGVWDESHVYSQAGYDPTTELRSLRAFVDPGVVFDTALSSIGDVFGSASYDRIIMYDATGARFFLQALPPQFNTMRYVAPGYGFWINVTGPSDLTIGFSPPPE